MSKLNARPPKYTHTHHLTASDGSVLHCTRDEKGTILPGFTGILERLDAIRNLAIRDDDIIVCTYPKSGTHWAGNIAYMLLHKEEIKQPDWTALPVRHFLEMVDAETYVDDPSRRVFCTHLTPDYLPYERIAAGKVKIIHVVRNPKDIVVSYFHHLIIAEMYEGTLNGMAELFLQKNGKGKIIHVKRNPKDLVASLFHHISTSGTYEGTLNGMVELFLQKNGKGKIIHVMRNPKDIMVSFFHHLSTSGSGTYTGTLNGLVELFLQKNGKAKVIHVMRNPKDIVVSYYHHIHTDGIYTGTLHGLAELFLQNNTAYGDWFAHKDAYAQFIGENCKDRSLSLVFEDMKEDPRGNVRRIAELLNVDVTEEEISLILELSSVGNMRQRLAGSSLDRAETIAKMIYRKGEVNDWKNHFTVATNEMFDREWARRKEERGEL